ncbi:14994_t:CDS:2 [Funneliformis caledonium]|uniref:14994_t:CDS:1 n=1 Tax=Funneliformis caledonium TaxID=1117310 RepID=A0A9N9CGD1_9GLOM|nr:14994_t:CDS:2 [Funneliformis caledonium]
MTFLKGYNFVITVVKDNKEHSECSGYLCDYEEFYTDELSNSSINGSKTRSLHPKIEQNALTQLYKLRFLLK